MEKHTRFVGLRMTKDLFERMKKSAKEKGYENFSDYVRTALVQSDFLINAQINEIYSIITGKNQMPKKKEKTLLAYIK